VMWLVTVPLAFHATGMVIVAVGMLENYRSVFLMMLFVSKVTPLYALIAMSRVSAVWLISPGNGAQRPPKMRADDECSARRSLDFIPALSVPEVHCSSRHIDLDAYGFLLTVTGDQHTSADRLLMHTRAAHRLCMRIIRSSFAGERKTQAN
jgi:hypothetical protein